MNDEKTAAVKLAFWSHQALEYLLGALIITQGIAGPAPVGSLIAGGAVILLAASADGPLAVSKWVNRPLHRWLDLAVAFGLVATAVWLHRRLDGFGIGVMIATAGVLLFLILRTDYRPKQKRERWLSGDGSTGGSAASEKIGRFVGRLTAKGMHAAKNRSRK